MKKTKMQLGKKLFLNKDHLITLTNDQSNGVAGGGTWNKTATGTILADNTKKNSCARGVSCDPEVC